MEEDVEMLKSCFVTRFANEYLWLVLLLLFEIKKETLRQRFGRDSDDDAYIVADWCVSSI